MVEDGRSLRQAIKDAGYSQAIADHPKRITDSKWFKTAIRDYEEESNIIKEEKRAYQIDHMIFPLMLSDDEIAEIVEGVTGNKVKKIRHGETQTHVWFYTPDHEARQKILDKIWKLTGEYAPTKTQQVNSYDEMTDDELAEERKKLEREKEERRRLLRGE